MLPELGETPMGLSYQVPWNPPGLTLAGNVEMSGLEGSGGSGQLGTLQLGLTPDCHPRKNSE